MTILGALPPIPELTRNTDEPSEQYQARVNTARLQAIEAKIDLLIERLPKATAPRHKLDEPPLTPASQESVS